MGRGGDIRTQITSHLDSCLAGISAGGDPAASWAEGASELKDKILSLISPTTASSASGDGEEMAVDAPVQLQSTAAAKMHLDADLELAFRERLRNLCAEAVVSPSSKDKIQQLLALSIYYAGLEGSDPGTGRIPALLLEDALEMSTTEDCKKLWRWLEESSALMKLGPLIRGATRAKTALLRLCNSLLRRLSKMHDTEFSGRVLLFLASVFPLGERSAVNLGGKRNTDNITLFEGEDEYEEAAKMLSRKRASLLDGVPASTSRQEGREDVDTGDLEEEESGNDNVLVDYALYQAFWGTQGKFLEVDKQLESEESWSTFISDLDKVLVSFEGNAFSEHDLRLATCISSKDNHGGEEECQSMDESAHENASADSSSTDGDDFFVCKYLTSSRLLRLQLRDPTLRLQILTQLLIVQRTLNVVLSGKLGTEDEAEVSLTKKRLADLMELSGRARALMKRTPPHGEKYQRILSRILKREANWILWKASKCPDMEAAAKSRGGEGRDQAAEESKQMPSASSRKRKRSSVSSRNHIPALLRPGAFENFDVKNLASISQGLAARAPGMDEHLQFLLECMDPASGVEDEYHPKHDKLYCWRATRLLARERAALLESMSGGNITAVANKLLGIAEDTTDKEEEKEVEENAAAEAEEADGSTEGKEAGNTAKEDADKERMPPPSAPVPKAEVIEAAGDEESEKEVAADKNTGDAMEVEGATKS